MENTIHIFTDGSHKKGSNKKGFGAYCNYNGTEYFMSGSEVILKEYDINTEVSNPTMEFLAFAEVLKTLAYYINDSKSKVLILQFWIDYIGIFNWMDGSWKCKADHIKKIKNKCDLYLSIIKRKYPHLKIEIKHVKGHSGNVGNDKADILAKDGNNINTFVGLFNDLFKDSY